MITSIHNPRIQLIRDLLASSKERTARQLFVIEGIRLIEEAWQKNFKPEIVFYTNELNPRGMDMIQNMTSSGTAIEEVDPILLKRISGTENPQGILAVMPMTRIDIQASPDFFLILDSIRDPGNLGTILRTACAAGVQAVLLSEDCADHFSPKVVRSAMGAHFHLPIFSMNWENIQATLLNYIEKHAIYLSDVNEGRSLWHCDLSGSAALIISNEATGASPQAAQLAGQTIHIPMPGNFESLNASIAAGILLFEVVRQRGKT